MELQFHPDPACKLAQSTAQPFLSHSEMLTELSTYQYQHILMVITNIYVLFKPFPHVNVITLLHWF